MLIFLIIHIYIGEMGMRAYFNPFGMPLSGWDDIDEQFSLRTNEKCNRLNEFASIDDMEEDDEEGKIRFHPDPDAKDAYGGAMSLGELSDAIQWEDWNCRDVSLAVRDKSFMPPYLGLLRGYLNAQFLRQVEIGRVIQCFNDEGRAVFVAFHTGLLTKREKNELFCVLQATSGKNTSSKGGESISKKSLSVRLPFELVAFVTKDRLRDPTMPWNVIEPLMRTPDPAIFYEEPIDLIYDSYATLDVDASFWEQLDDLSIVNSFLPKSLCNSQYLRRISAKEAINRAERICKLDPKQAALTYSRHFGPRQPGELRMVLPLTFIDHENYKASTSGDSGAHIGNCALICSFMKSKRGCKVYRAIGLCSLETAFIEARVIGSVQQAWLRRDGPKLSSPQQLQQQRANAQAGIEELNAQFESSMKQLQPVRAPRAKVSKDASPTTPDGQSMYSHKYGAAKRSPVSPVEIEEDEDDDEDFEVGVPMNNNTMIAQQGRYASALAMASSSSRKPPLYGHGKPKPPAHDWIEPRSKKQQHQQQKNKRGSSDEEDFLKEKSSAAAAAAVATEGSLQVEFEEPKVNIPNLPESVLDEVYQNAGLLVSYSDIRDVTEMPDDEKRDYTRRQKQAHKLAEDIVQRELAPFGEILEVKVRPTKHAADQMYAVVTFKKWLDLEAKEAIESGNLFNVENFFDDKGKIVMRRSERDFGKSPVKKKPANGETTKGSEQDDFDRMPVARPGWKASKHTSLTGQRLFQGSCGNCKKTCFVPFMPIDTMPVPKCSQCMNAENARK